MRSRVLGADEAELRGVELAVGVLSRKLRTLLICERQFTQELLRNDEVEHLGLLLGVA